MHNFTQQKNVLCRFHEKKSTIYIFFLLMAAFDVYSKIQSNLIYMSSHQILLRVTVGDFGTLVGFIGQIWDVWGLSLRSPQENFERFDEEFGSRLIDTTQWDSHPHDNFHLTLVWTQSLTIIITPGRPKRKKNRSLFLFVVL